MVVGLVSAAQIRFDSLRALSLDPTRFDLTTPEALASALRRAAGFLCPCSRSALRKAVADTIVPLTSATTIDDDIDNLTESLLAYGDIFEFQDSKEQGHLVHTVVPGYVLTTSGVAFLFGIVPDHNSPFPADLESRIEYTGHLRRLLPGPGNDLTGELRRLGLREISLADWTKSPTSESASSYVNRFDVRLASATRAGEVPNLVVLNPDTPVSVYRNRWTGPGELTGRFVGRRPQRYGAALWCYLELDRGTPQRLVDLPVLGEGERGCDEAWRLQAAIDAHRGQPQRALLRRGPGGTVILSCYGPVPQWAQRRLDLLGRPTRVPGALFAYVISESDGCEEACFLEKRLWFTTDDAGGRGNAADAD